MSGCRECLLHLWYEVRDRAKDVALIGALIVVLLVALTVAACGSVVESSPSSLAPLPRVTRAPQPLATASVTAVRETASVVVETEPPPTVPTGLHGLSFAPEGLSDCEEMAFYRVQAGLPDRFGGPEQTGLGWRESNCRNEDGVRTSCCHGYWQLHRQHFNGSGFVYGVDCQALDKQRQACSAKALYDEVGYSAWVL